MASNPCCIWLPKTSLTLFASWRFCWGLFPTYAVVKLTAWRSSCLRGLLKAPMHRSCLPLAREGLYVPTSAPWYTEFKSELLSFPAGKHDDQIDALGLIGQLLDQMTPGQNPKLPEKPKLDTGYRPYRAASRLDDWVTY
jgi:hypothetical protein